jgi:hypothetical protein
MEPNQYDSKLRSARMKRLEDVKATQVALKEVSTQA